MTTTWNEIAYTLLSIAPQTHQKHQWRHRLSSDVDNPDTAKDILRLEEPYAAEIDAAVAAWTIGTSFQKLSPEASLLLEKRCHTAFSFAKQHTSPGKGMSKLIAAPQCGLEEGIKSLLSEYWKEHGYVQFYYTVALESIRFKG